MTDVFYLRPMDPPVTPESTLASGERAGGCFGLHRVAWMHSFLSEDGGRMLCWYRAPDAESARIALRELGADPGGVWPGRVLGEVEPGHPAVSRVNVLVELPFDRASDLPIDAASHLRLAGASHLPIAGASDLPIDGASHLQLDGASHLPREDSLLERMRRATEGRAEVAFAFLSNRRDRLVGLLEGADSQAVASALARDGFAAARAWNCQVVTPP